MLSVALPIGQRSVPGLRGEGRRGGGGSGPLGERVSEPVPPSAAVFQNSHSHRRPEKCGGCRDSARARPISSVTEQTRARKRQPYVNLGTRAALYVVRNADAG